MQILKKADAYNRARRTYVTGPTDIVCDNEYKAWSVARLIGKQTDVSAWFKANSRCTGCVLRMTQDEHAYVTRVQTYGDMPQEAIADVEAWPIKSKSPYSNSWYSADNITWDYKPEGSYRISDHWGWEQDGTRHCELADAPGYQVGWRLAIRKDGKYHTVKVYALDTDSE